MTEPTSRESTNDIETLSLSLSEIQGLRIDELQKEIRSLRAQMDADRKHPHTTRRAFFSPLAQATRWRGRRISIGLSLALLLLIAPSQSGVVSADANGSTLYGDHALAFNTTGSYNSAFGSYALNANTSGDHNVATGEYALYFNKTGYRNTASGYDALFNNTAGLSNSAFGIGSLRSNTTGSDNVATGSASVYLNSSGDHNTAVGNVALYFNSTGAYNTAVGDHAGVTATPANGSVSGSNNTFIGYNSGPGTSSEINNATAIGSNAVVSQSNSIVLGGTGDNTQRVGVGTATPHSALQIAKGFLQLRPITGPPPAEMCSTPDDYGRMAMRTDGTTNLYV